MKNAVNILFIISLSASVLYNGTELLLSPIIERYWALFKTVIYIKEIGHLWTNSLGPENKNINDEILPLQKDSLDWRALISKITNKM